MMTSLCSDPSDVLSQGLADDDQYDSRGVRRSRCKVTDCDCDQFAADSMGNACGFCKCPAARHAKFYEEEEPACIIQHTPVKHQLSSSFISTDESYNFPASQQQYVLAASSIGNSETVHTTADPANQVYYQVVSTPPIVYEEKHLPLTVDITGSTEGEDELPPPSSQRARSSTPVGRDRASLPSGESLFKGLTLLEWLRTRHSGFEGRVFIETYDSNQTINDTSKKILVRCLLNHAIFVCDPDRPSARVMTKIATAVETELGLSAVSIYFLLQLCEKL